MKLVKITFGLVFFSCIIISWAFTQTAADFYNSAAKAAAANTDKTSVANTAKVISANTAGTAPSTDLARIAAELKVQTAIASPDYRVTAGDVYGLAFMIGNEPITYVITVDSSYKIRVVNLGIIDAAGKTYMQLKNQVETIVSNNYAFSAVQFVLTKPAVFRVYLKGEVAVAGEREAWALDRLSSAVSWLTPLSSLRDITVQSTGGQVRTYDLFKAWRFGELSQDPYLRPGDTIIFNRVKRAVVINGEVERPETYQLLPGENLKELIEVYGSGFTPLADPTRIEVTRYVNSVSVSGNKILPGEGGLGDNFSLEHYDMVMVPAKTQLQPVLFVEGAVAAFEEEDVASKVPASASSIQIASRISPTSSPVSAVPTASTRLVVPFNKGEYYGSMVRRNSKWFSAVSDTQNAYIIRGDSRIPINLNPLLYDESYRGEVSIEDNDTLVIPFRQYFVTVAGAVVVPGRYPYIPDRGWEYYIALAGGFIPERNKRESITITDIAGNQLNKTDGIMPETIITAKTNHALYYFTRYAPVITTMLSIIGTTLSVIAATRR
ncbi:MAG: SLBB domain-containing protein [Treponema sp.]|jgi:protein involved in polysaccharide export with SLBB domain|nr:SLBB domain-containing protein [Treponema sp.]